MQALEAEDNGGRHGVVYALLGVVWMRGRWRRELGTKFIVTTTPLLFSLHLRWKGLVTCQVCASSSCPVCDAIQSSLLSDRNSIVMFAARANYTYL